MDIRVGRVLKAERVPETKKLIVLEIDIGEEKPRRMVAQSRMKSHREAP